MDCGCGRSPTGKCIGWHKLSEEEYQQKLKEYEEKIINADEKIKDLELKLYLKLLESIQN